MSESSPTPSAAWLRPGWDRLTRALAWALAHWPRLLGAACAVLLLWIFVAADLDHALKRSLCRSLGAACEPPGRVFLGSAEIYTRERLVDDRLEHVNWINRQLRGLDEAPLQPFRSLGSTEERRRQVSAVAAGQAPPQGTVEESRRESTPFDEDRQPTVARYRQLSYFRELLRAERTRATLDDRHDIEGNTILQMVFDATVIPPRSRRGLAVITVGLGAVNDEKLQSLRDADAQRLYHDWLLTLEPEIDLGVQQRALGILRLSDPPPSLADVRELLGARLCEAVQQHMSPVSTEQKPQDRLLACFRRVAAPGVAASGGEEGQPVSDDDIAGFAARLDELVQTARARFNEIARKDYEGRIEEISRQILSPIAARLGMGDGLRHRLPDYVTLVEQCRPRPDQADLPPERIRLLDDREAEMLRRASPNAPITGLIEGRYIEIPCPSVFRLREEVLLLHQLAEAMEPGRPGSPGMRALGEALLGTGQATPSSFAACIVFDHAFVPNTMRRALLEPRRDCGGTRGHPDQQAVIDEQRVIQVRVNAAEVRCAAAQMRRMAFSRPAGLPASSNDALGPDGQPLSHFVHLRLVRGGDGACRLRAEPLPGQGDASGWGRLRAALQRVPIDVYAYGLAPRNATQRIESRVEDGIALSFLMGNVAGREGAAQEVVASLARRFAGGQDQPFVVGFGSENATDEPARARAAFGWILAPRRSGPNEDTHTLETHTLSAILSVPSWWRRAELQIRECWVSAADLPEAMQRLRQEALDRKPLSNKDERAFGCAPRQITLPRLPGGEADLTRALRIEVIRTPYLRVGDEPVRYTARVGEPASFRIAGGRLWRSTGVTLGGQLADRIRILPNMMGIIAEFRCVQRPAMERRGEGGGAMGAAPAAGRSADTGGSPGRIMVPLEVWTSEGVIEGPLTVEVIDGTPSPRCLALSDTGAGTGTGTGTGTGPSPATSPARGGGP
jgi:hypothetical protein